MNTEHIPSLSNSANFRIPDILSHASKLIGDIKVNGTTLRLTAQLRDFIEYAERQGYKFILRVSDPGKVHPALRMEIERIGGQIEGMD